MTERSLPPIPVARLTAAQVELDGICDTIATLRRLLPEAPGREIWDQAVAAAQDELRAALRDLGLGIVSIANLPAGLVTGAPDERPVPAALLDLTAWIRRPLPRFAARWIETGPPSPVHPFDVELVLEELEPLIESLRAWIAAAPIDQASPATESSQDAPAKDGPPG